MTPEQRAEWQSLKRSEYLQQSHIDQWWREFEQHKDALQRLVKMLPNSVLRGALMLVLLQISLNMLSRSLDEIE